MKIAQVVCFPLLFSLVVISCNKKGDDSPQSNRLLPVIIVTNNSDTQLLKYDNFSRLIYYTTRHIVVSQDGNPTICKVFYKGNSQFPIGFKYWNDTILSSYDLLGRTNAYNYPAIDLAVKTVVGDSNNFYQDIMHNDYTLHRIYEIIIDSIFFKNENAQMHSFRDIRTINNGKDTILNYYSTTTYQYTNYLNPFRDLMGYNLVIDINAPTIPNKNLLASECFVLHGSNGNCCDYSIYYSYTFDSIGRLESKVSNCIPVKPCQQNLTYTYTTKYYYK